MKKLKYADKWLLISTLLLFAIGLVMVFSASNVAAFMRYAESPYKYVIKQALFLMVGLFTSLVIINIPNKNFFKFCRFLTFAFLLSLILIFKFGVVINNARSWYSIFGIVTIQPSEFMKVLIIVFMCDYYERCRGALDKYNVVLYPVFISLVAAVLIALQPDFGTALIFGFIVAFIFFTSMVCKDIKVKMGIALGCLILVGTIIIGSFFGSSFMKTVQKRADFMNPCSEEKFYSSGNQVCNGYIAFNNGGLFGKGLGNSTQKYLYLPEAHTDFIFAIIVEECGLLFGIFVLFLYIFVLLRIIYIGKRSHSNRNALMCYAVAFYLMLHIVINLTGVLGLLPLTGVPLPFLSYGGSFLLCCCISVAIVQRVAIENNSRKIPSR